MAALTKDIDIVERVLCGLAGFYAQPDKYRTLVAFDHEHGQFLIIDEGWDGYKRVHSVWAHVELRDDQFWIHEDGTQQGIGNLLLDEGVARERIVTVFNTPTVREMAQVS